MSKTERTQIDDGGSAFPVPVSQHVEINNTAEIKAEGTWANGINIPAPHPPTFSTGMSLRDWFAGQAMGNLFNGKEWSVTGDFSPAVYGGVARQAYRFADAMLAARKEPHHAS